MKKHIGKCCGQDAHVGAQSTIRHVRTARIGIAAAVLVLASSWIGTRIEAAAAVVGKQYAGAWSGTWEGGGSGKFDMTLQVGSDGKLGGEVAVGSDQGDYTAQFTKVSFAGNKLTATYDYPLAAEMEVRLDGTFSGKSASGTWKMGAKGESETQATIAAGTWKIEKK